MDNFKDLEELGIRDDGEQTCFNAAANHVQKIAANLCNEDLLQLYGFYKQGLDGNCNMPKPSWYDFRAKSKWDAWNALKDMPKQEAQNKYVQLVSNLDSTFTFDNHTTSTTAISKQTSKEGWVTVSTLQQNDSDDDADADELTMLVKAGDHIALKRLGDTQIKYKSFDWDAIDRDGMSLIHWASDRGFSTIIKYLIEKGANVHAKDAEGQTALHYASSCGHYDCVELLLEMGADVSAKDNDGADSSAVAADDTIRALLTKCHS